MCTCASPGSAPPPPSYEDGLLFEGCLGWSLSLESWIFGCRAMLARLCVTLRFPWLLQDSQPDNL